MSLPDERSYYFQPPPGSYVDLDHKLGEKCVGWWVPNQYGSATMCDISGKNNHGTLVGPPDYVQGKFGGEWALDYDGNNEHVYIPTAIGTSKSNVTSVVWFHLTGVALNGAFHKIGSVAAIDRGYALGVGSNTFDVAGNDLIGLEEGTAWLDTNHAIGTGWHSAAHVRDAASQHDLYLDGQFIQHFANVSPKGIVVDDAQIGGYAARHFPGKIIQTVFYSRMVPAEQLAWLHDQPCAPITTPKPRRKYCYTAAPPVGTPYYYRYLNRLWGETA